MTDAELLAWMPLQTWRLNGCWVWKWQCDTKGYGMISYQTPDYVKGVSKPRSRAVHRVMYALSNGLTLADIKGRSVRHTCDNPPCINPKHLLLGSHADNMRDMSMRGRTGNRKLTDAKVWDMRHRYARKECTQYDLAAEHGVDRRAIHFALIGKTFAHVGGPLAEVQHKYASKRHSNGGH